MSARSSQRRRRGDPGGGHGGGGMERWLLTYADMITLLMALFIVMWSISVVNVGKFEELKVSLKAAFSGKLFAQSQHVMSGERSVLSSGGSQSQSSDQTASSEPQLPKLPIHRTPVVVPDPVDSRDLENLRKLQRQVERYARKHGLNASLRTSIDERGLVIRLLTDDLLFDTGRAELTPRSLPILGEISRLVRAQNIQNAIRVEGNTDNVPISTFEFRSNWELSTARATAVLEQLLADGLAPARLSAAGYADQRPVQSNATAAGRQRNRRVDLVILRRRLAAVR